MSWSRHALWLGPAACVVAAGLLGGCGFEPLYAKSDQETALVSQELAAIEVPLIDDPLGVELRNQLLGNIAPTDPNQPARYQLAIQLSKSKIPLITEKDSQISRFDFVLVARYTLTDKASGAMLANGSVRSATSYNIVQAADFASLVAEQSAGKQAAREASREIVTRLALYFDGATS